MLSEDKVKGMFEEAEFELNACVKNEQWGEAEWWQSRRDVLKEVLDQSEGI